MGTVCHSIKIPAQKILIVTEMVARSCKKLFYSAFYHKHIFTQETKSYLKWLSTKHLNSSSNYTETMSDNSTLKRTSDQFNFQLGNNTDTLSNFGSPFKTNDKLQGYPSPNKDKTLLTNVSYAQPDKLSTIKEEEDASDIASQKTGKKAKQHKEKIIEYLEDFCCLILGDPTTKICRNFWDGNIKDQVFEDFGYYLTSHDIKLINYNTLKVNLSMQICIGRDIYLEKSESSSCGFIFNIDGADNPFLTKTTSYIIDNSTLDRHIQNYEQLVENLDTPIKQENSQDLKQLLNLYYRKFQILTRYYEKSEYDWSSIYNKLITCLLKFDENSEDFVTLNKIA